MPSSTIQDTSNLHSWTQKTLERDENGFLIGEVVTYDDGRIRTITWTDGVKTLVTWSDPTNATDWTSISTTYDPTTGQKTAQTRTMDDGRIISTTFVEGVISERVLTDVANEFNWSSVTRSYDAEGRISSSVVSYDDGRTSNTTYVNGVLDQRTVTDTDGAFGWASKVYDWNPADGQLLTVTTTLDDGTIIVKGPALGPEGSTVTRTDSADKFVWDSRETAYNAAGVIDQLTVEYDDGRVAVTDFTNGVRSQTDISDVDDAKAWDTVELTYDAKGQLIGRNTIYDDGREVTFTYQDGVLVSKMAIDDLDQHGWETVTTTYDANGRIATKLDIRDNGVTVSSTYSEGIIQSSTQSDTDDAYRWQTVERQYDAVSGALIYANKVFDDGSEISTDERGLEIVTGGTTGSVTEDTAPTLVTAGTIDLVDDYRGSTTFTPQTEVAGNNGLGVFALQADGTWTYSADNAQGDIQELNEGEILTDSFTAVTTDGLETLVTVAIQGVTNNDAPVFVGGEPLGVGAAGNEVVLGGSIDLNPFFADARGDTVTLTMGTVPTGYSFANGVLSLTDFTNLALAGDHTFAVTATDQFGASLTQNITFMISLNHDFGANYDGSTNAPAGVSGSSAQDTILFGDDAGNVTLNTLAGDDAVSFGDRAAYNNSGSNATTPLIVVNTHEGNDTINFGDDAGRFGGTVSVDAGSGNDLITFGNGGTTQPDSLISVMGGEGADTISGGAGNDLISGGAGADILMGGAGLDHLSYQGSSEGVAVDLRADENGFQAVSGGDAEGDSVKDFERVIGSDFGDTLIGHSGENTIYGLGGDDVIRGSDDEDSLYGGNGFDTVDFSASSFGVTVDLRTDTAGMQGTDEADVLSGFEAVIGSSHDDILVAGSDYSVLEGRGGADTFFLTDNAGEGQTHRIVDFSTDEDGLQLDLSRFGRAFELFVGAGEEEGEGGLSDGGIIGDGGFIGDEGGFGDEGEGSGDEGDGDEGEIEGLFHLQSHEFVANTTGQAEDEHQHIIYNTNTGMVFFDADGTGDAEAFEIVQLQAGLNLDHTLIKGFNAPNRAPIAQDISITLDANSLVDYMPLLVTDMDGIRGHSYSFAPVGGDAYLGRIFHFSPKLLSFNTDGDFDYLRAGETATQTIEYTVTDSAGATDSALVHMTIMGVEDRPIAVNDTFTGVEDTTLTLTPQLNDIDPEGGATLKIIAVGATPFGTATVAADGLSIEFVPNPDFTGDFDLTYVIRDDTGLTGSGVMNITITNTNDAPVAENITSSVTAGNSVRLVPEYTDPDPLDATSVTLNMTGAVGSAVVNDDGETVFTSNNSYELLDTIQYTATGWEHLGAGETAVDTFQATLTDLDGLSSTVDVSVTVTGVNDAVIARDDVFEVDEKTTTIFTPLANDEDPDQNDTLNIQSVFNTGNNRVTISGDRQSLSFTPWPGVYGETTFSYYVASSDGTFDTADITVNVIDVNDAPVAPDLVFYSDPSYYDVDLDEVIYSYTNQALNITDSDLADGEVINYGDYVFDITPPANAQGFAQFSFIGSELFTPETGFSTIDQYSIQYASATLSGAALFEADRTEVYTYTVTDEAGAGLTSNVGTITIITQKLEVAPILRYNANRTFNTEQRDNGDPSFTLSTDRFDFYDQNGDGFKLHAIRSLDDSTYAFGFGVSLVDDPAVEGDEHVTLSPPAEFWGTLDFEVQMIDDTGLVSDWTEFELDIAPVAKPMNISMEFLPRNSAPTDAASMGNQTNEMGLRVLAQQDNIYNLYLPVAYSDLDILDGNGVDVTTSILGDNGFRDFSNVEQTDFYWDLGILYDTYSFELPEELDGDYTFKVSVNHGTPDSNITSVSEKVVSFTTTQTAVDGVMDIGNTPLWEGGPQTAGFDLGGTFTVGDSFNQRLFQFDTRIGGVGPGVTADMSIEASGEVSVTAFIRPEFTVSGGGITGTLGFDASIKTQHNSATDGVYFYTDALLDAESSSFTATSPDLGFDLSITDLALAAEAFLRVGGYVDFHTGVSTTGVAPDVEFEVPAVDVDALDLVGLEKLSLINYDGTTEKLSLLKDLPVLGDLLTATGTSISQSFTSGAPLGNELAHITVTKPELSVQDQISLDYRFSPNPYLPFQLEEDGLLRGESEADFINFELDLDGVASTLMGKKNLLDLGIGFDASIVEFDAFLELLDFDIRADVKYKQTNDLYRGELFGNVVFENGDAFDFAFGDDFHVGNKAALDQDGDGAVSYELTTYSTAKVRTKAEALLDLYDYISVFDAGVSLEFGGGVKDALDSIGIPTDINIGTDGPLWDNRGYFIDGSWAETLAWATTEVTTTDVEQGFFFV